MKILDFEITPAFLTPWLTDKQLNENVIFLNLQIDRDEMHDEFRFDLDVVFDRRRLSKSKGITRKDFYVGFTGAEVEVSFKDSLISDYTPAQIINKETDLSRERIRVCDLQIKPNIGTLGGLDVLKFSKSQKVIFNSKFHSEERTLQPIDKGRKITFEITQTREDKVVRDYLAGNLYLFVKFKSQNKNKSATIYVRPSNIIFFDNKKKELRGLDKYLFEFTLDKRKVPLKNRFGFHINVIDLDNE